MSNKVNHWKTLWANNRRRRYFILCFSMAAMVGIAQPMLIHHIYSEAKLVELLKNIKDASLYFGSAISTASATVLALMLTLLSMARQVDKEFNRSIYRGIRLIGFVSAAAFIISILLLLCLSLPIGEFQGIPSAWFKALYYTITVLNGVMSGLMIFGVLTLFEIISSIIHEISPENQQSENQQSEA